MVRRPACAWNLPMAINRVKHLHGESIVSTVQLLSKPGCHLCDEARNVIADVCAELGEDFDELDITTDRELMAQYSEQIPVVFVDGKQHDFWRVDPNRLRAAMRA
jgi:glutaredoxin